MDTISITNRELDYGIKVEDIFWVRQGVLLKEDIRDSRDEEIIADLIAYIISPNEDKPASSRSARDAFYGRSTNSSTKEIERAQSRKSEMDTLVYRFGEEALKRTIQSTVDSLDDLFDEPGGFRKIFYNVSLKYGTPRYFQVVFLAFYELFFNDKLVISDRQGLLKALDGLNKHVNISTGGNWAAANRSKNIAVVKGLIRDFFKSNPHDPVAASGRTEFINLISRSKTEAANYDFKQGLHRLDDSKSFDDAAFNNILNTICAIANLGRNKVGYIVLGIADTKRDADRVRTLYGTSLERIGDYFVVGIDREADLFHTSMDKYQQFISDRIDSSDLSDDTKRKVVSQISPIDYAGRTSLVIRVESGTEPCSIGDKFYRRVGAQTIEVPPREFIHLARLF